MQQCYELTARMSDYVHNVEMYIQKYASVALRIQNYTTKYPTRKHARIGVNSEVIMGSVPIIHYLDVHLVGIIPIINLYCLS